jgi:dynein heavy chain
MSGPLKLRGYRAINIYLTFLTVFQVLGISESIKNTLPENIDYETTAKILSIDPSPLNVVLLQEVSASMELLSDLYVPLQHGSTAIKLCMIM